MAVMKIKNVVLRSQFKKPATLLYPVVCREYPEKGKGHIAVDMSTCICCSICAKKCPADAIKVDRANKSWEISRMSCVQCGCCVDCCPKGSLTMENTYTQPDVSLTVDTFFKPEEEAPAEAAEK